MIKYISFDLDGTLVDKKFDDLIWFREVPYLFAKKNGLFFEEALKKVKKEYDKFKGQSCWTDIEFWFNHFNLKESWEEVIEEIAHEIKIYNEVINALEIL